MELNEHRARAEDLKAMAVEGVDARKEELIEISLKIHENPEILFQEFASSKLLAEYLGNNCFQVEYPAYGLDTAFRASVGSGRPSIGIMAEYDALPELGHGCGHNIIGTAAAGAGVALASVIKELGGSVTVFGTPGEEGGNAKQLMADQGAFDNLDAAMMIHPWNSDFLYNNTFALSTVIEVEYFGKGCHASQPERGTNALDAMMIGYNAFKIVAPVFPGGRFNPTIITNGGAWIAIVPDYTKAQVLIPGRDDKALREAITRAENCFKAGAVATGARMEFHCDWERRYRTTYSNRAVADCFHKNMSKVRKTWNPPGFFPGSEVAATDMGSVSQKVPSIHAWIAITEPTVMFHTPESAGAAASSEGHKALIDGAKAMAMTCIDLLCDAELLKAAHVEFERTMKQAGGMDVSDQ